MGEDGAGGPSPERGGDCRSRDRGEGGRAACRARSHLRQWTSGQRPAVGGGEQDLPHSTGTWSLHHSSRLGLSSPGECRLTWSASGGVPCIRSVPWPQHGPAGQSLGRGGDGSAPLQEASVTAHPHTLRWRHERGAGGTSPVKVCP